MANFKKTFFSDNSVINTIIDEVKEQLVDESKVRPKTAMTGWYQDYSKGGYYDKYRAQSDRVDTKTETDNAHSVPSLRK